VWFLEYLGGLYSKLYDSLFGKGFWKGLLYGFLLWFISTIIPSAYIIAIFQEMSITNSILIGGFFFFIPWNHNRVATKQIE